MANRISQNTAKRNLALTGVSLPLREDLRYRLRRQHGQSIIPVKNMGNTGTELVSDTILIGRES